MFLRISLIDVLSSVFLGFNSRPSNSAFSLLYFLLAVFLYDEWQDVHPYRFFSLIGKVFLHLLQINNLVLELPHTVMFPRNVMVRNPVEPLTLPGFVILYFKLLLLNISHCVVSPFTRQPCGSCPVSLCCIDARCCVNFSEQLGKQAAGAGPCLAADGSAGIAAICL